MIIKWIGALCIIIACLGFGLMLAALHRREVKTLKNLISALDFMECELQFRMPSLSELCSRTAECCQENLRRVFTDLSSELENQIAPDVKHCMESVLSKSKDIPVETQKCLSILGENLGKFNLQGQLKGLESVQAECKERLRKLVGNYDMRLRSYQTLGLCGGVALIILLM